MSERNDSRLARWSRRKLAARHDETDEAEKRQNEPVPEVSADGSPLLPEMAGEAAEPAEPPEPLPRIEDLTADSDLTAFLKKGVPMALKSAALRKMWSIDPSIRDYVGPAEYAWDFNQPGSMAGFGPLDPKKSVVGFLSRTVRALGEDAEQTASIRPADEAADVEADAQAMVETPSVVPPAQPQAVRAPVILAGSERDVSAETQHQPAAVVVPAPQSGDSPDSQPLPRPRHGGAMPR